MKLVIILSPCAKTSFVENPTNLSLCGIYFLHNHPFGNRDTEAKSDPLFNVVYGKILRTNEFPSQRDFLYTMASIFSKASFFYPLHHFFCFLIRYLCLAPFCFSIFIHCIIFLFSDWSVINRYFFLTTDVIFLCPDWSVIFRPQEVILPLISAFLIRSSSHFICGSPRLNM